LRQGKKIAYAAIMTAICVVAMYITRLLPIVGWIPMSICILALFVCKQKGGLAGFAFALVASTTLVFLTLQISFASLGYVFFVVPYSTMSVLLYKFKYSGGIKAISIRLVFLLAISLLASIFAISFVNIFLGAFGFLDGVNKLQLFFIVLGASFVVFLLFDFSTQNALRYLEKSNIFFDNNQKQIKEEQEDIFE